MTNITRIGDSRPPFRICTAVLAWSSALKFREYNRLFQDYVKYLSCWLLTENGAHPTEGEKLVGRIQAAVHRGVDYLIPLLEFTKLQALSA